ncbi:MAG: ribose-phosphate diphosphokinase, partial [Actinobacteria bacterium]|nr:ribose-phosphate diphosphokinase [Actinomycetota bacterium]
HRHRGEVVHRTGEESLDLSAVQVDRHHALGTGRGKHVGDESRRDRLATLGLAVLARVSVERTYRSHALGRCAIGGVDHDQLFHDRVVHAATIDPAVRLHDEHVTAMPVLEKYVRSNVRDGVVIVSPDAGRVKVAERFAQHLADMNADVAFINKRRPKGTTNVAVAKEVIGEVEGKLCILTDDMIDTGGTIVSAAELLIERGAREVWAMATHGVLSGPAIERLAKAPIERVVLTNTIPLPADKRLPKIEVLSVAKILADALSAVFDETSVSDLFDGENQS